MSIAAVEASQTGLREDRDSIVIVGHTEGFSEDLFIEAEKA